MMPKGAGLATKKQQNQNKIPVEKQKFTGPPADEENTQNKKK